MCMADIKIRDEGSIVLFDPQTDAAREWIKDNVPEPMYFGKALVVEHRYADDLAQGMISDGLDVESA